MYVHASLGAEYVFVGEAATKAERVEALLVVDYRLFVGIFSPWFFRSVELPPRLVIQKKLHHFVVCLVDRRRIALEVYDRLAFGACFSSRVHEYFGSLLVRWSTHSSQ